MSDTLHVLCAGAVQGVVKALHARFERESGAKLEARFGAVGAMKEALLAGEPCDVMIVTEAMIVELQSAGTLSIRAPAPLGRVRSGIAVRRGASVPSAATPEALKACLRAAPAIYFADPQRATAGVHFASVLARLELADELASRLRTFPDGASAMRELVAGEAGAIGCTQITEILYTPGLVLVGPLPEAFELATEYTAAATARAAQPVLAQRFIDLLAGPATHAMRAEAGFEFDQGDP